MRECKLIDCHFHLTPNGEDIGTLGARMEQIWRARGLDAIGILCVPIPVLNYFHADWRNTTDARQIFSAFLLKALWPEKVYVFGALDYTGEGAIEGKADFAAQGRRLYDMGVDGIKMLEGKPTSRRLVKVPLDSPVYDPFYEFLVEKSLPLLSHVADPEICWDAQNAPDYFRKAGYFYADGALPSFEGFRQEALNVARKHPRLKMTFAHFFFASPDVDKAARFMDSYPNIGFDLTPGWEMYPNFGAKRDEWRDFFIRYDSRILFGTEGGLSSLGDEAGLKGRHEVDDFIRNFLAAEGDMVHSWPGFTFPTKGLKLLPESVRKICAGNFLDRVSNKPPRPLNRPLIISECNRDIARLRGDKSGSPEHGIEAEELERIVSLLREAG
jgi:hypothetical protein